MATKKITISNTGTAVGDGTKVIILDANQGTVPKQFASSSEAAQVKLVAAFTNVSVTTAPDISLFRPLIASLGWYTFDCASLNQKLWIACTHYPSQEIVYTESA